MMIEYNNPWDEVSRGARRRANLKYDIFWVKEDSQGDYGICIEVPSKEEIPISKLELKDIDVLKGLNRVRETFEWFLILRNREEWQIFLVLCEDLIREASKAEDEKAMLIVMETRLKRWQNLLKKSLTSSLTVELQMGLFAELSCLKHFIAPQLGLPSAIQMWVGPESDKQDYLLDKLAIEVKSYRTSKGDKVTISSKEQLSSEKELLYLFTYALTISENGQSIAQIVNNIKVELERTDNYSIIDLLDIKLLEYGYSPILHKEENLEKFIVDKTRAFIVDEEFPKITSGNIPLEITSIKYQIDLSRCNQFEVELKYIVI